MPSLKLIMVTETYTQ